MNVMIKELYNELSVGFKKDMGKYAQLYKTRYPHLRKRGMSAYAVFLMVVYALVRRFGLDERSVDEMKIILLQLIRTLSVADSIRMKLLKTVKTYYTLNHVALVNIRNTFEKAEWMHKGAVFEDFLFKKREIFLKSG